MSDNNGTTVTVTPMAERHEPYRAPEANISKVHDAICGSHYSVVFEAAHQASKFAIEANSSQVDTATRLGHLVDMTECLEIALTHVGQWKAAMSHRLQVEDERNSGSGF